MRESESELRELQALLDQSRASATAHLRGIIDDERALGAVDIAGLLTGMKVVAMATVTATGEPRISALDGHFLHGTWTFSTSGTAAKARHLESRPAVSVAHIDHESFAVFAHGGAVRISSGNPEWEDTLDHWTTHYGASPLSWGEDVRLYRLQPTWMVGYAWKRTELLAANGLTG